MTDDQIAKIATDAVRAMMAKLRWQVDRRTAYGVLLMVSLKLLRLTEGDEFVKGWLRGALVELDTSKPGVFSGLPH